MYITLATWLVTSTPHHSASMAILRHTFNERERRMFLMKIFFGRHGECCWLCRRNCTRHTIIQKVKDYIVHCIYVLPHITPFYETHHTHTYLSHLTTSIACGSSLWPAVKYNYNISMNDPPSHSYICTCLGLH